MVRWFHLRTPLVFISLFVVLEGLFEFLVLLLNPDNDIFINLILIFPNYLDFCYYFLQMEQIFHVKLNEIFHSQWCGCLDLKGQDLWVSMGIWSRTIQMQFLLVFNEMPGNGIYSLLSSILSFIEG